MYQFLVSILIPSGSTRWSTLGQLYGGCRANLGKFATSILIVSFDTNFQIYIYNNQNDEIFVVEMCVTLTFRMRVNVNLEIKVEYSALYFMAILMFSLSATINEVLGNEIKSEMFDIENEE